MCIDGENAAHISEYINTQLLGLYRIAVDCSIHHNETPRYDADGQLVKSSTLPGYDTALAEYHSKGGEFHATFGPPSVRFVCNHNAIVRIDVQSATLTTEGEAVANASSRQAVRGTNSAASLATNAAEFSGKISVRVPFVDYQVKRDALDYGVNGISTYILDFSHAHLVDIDDVDTEVPDAFKPAFEEYLKFLIKSGNNVFTSLPDFDDDLFERAVDFCSPENPDHLVLKEIYGICLTKISKYQQSIWREAAWSVQGREGEVDLSARLNTAIVEWDSAWLATPSNSTDNFDASKLQFFAKFGAPVVEFRCEHEAVLYFQIDEVLFKNDGQGPSGESRKDWLVAVIVNVRHLTPAGDEDEDEDEVAILALDTTKKATFSRSLSRLPDLDAVAANEDFSAFFDFLSTEYLHILQDSGFYIYRTVSSIEPPVPAPSEDEHGWSEKTVTQTEMHGFEQIVVLTQSSVDEIFESLYQKHGFLQAETQLPHFSAEYGPLKIHFLSGERALLFVQLKKGSLKTLRDGAYLDESDGEAFQNWELAFEVGIVMRSEEVTADYEDTEAYKGFNDSEGDATSIQHISLDFTVAKFLHEHSNFNDESFGVTRAQIETAVTAAKYVKDYYFRSIVEASAHILYSISISDAPSVERVGYSFTEATFHVYSEFVVDNSNYKALSREQQPVIAIFGMTTPELPMPLVELPYSTSWLYRAPVTFGTLALSSNAFLKARLLPLLEYVNRATTVVPAHIDVDGSDLVVDLTTWNEKYREDPTRRAGWEEVAQTQESFDFEWVRAVEYEYKYHGKASNVPVGSYNLSLTTDNHLSIPYAALDGRLDIELSGVTTVALGSTRAGQTTRSEAFASWSLTISAVATGNGLRIELTNEFSPVFNGGPGAIEVQTEGRNANVAQSSGQKPGIQDGPTAAPSLSLDPSSLLQAAFPEQLDLQAELRDLKSLENAWSSVYPGFKVYNLTNPVFTVNGDLLMELSLADSAIERVRETVSALVAATRPVRSSTLVGDASRRVSREVGNNPAYGVAATLKKVAVLEPVNFGDVSQSTTSAEDNTVSSAALDTPVTPEVPSIPVFVAAPSVVTTPTRARFEPSRINQPVALTGVDATKTSRFSGSQYPRADSNINEEVNGARNGYGNGSGNGIYNKARNDVVPVTNASANGNLRALQLSQSTKPRNALVKPQRSAASLRPVA